MSKLRKLASQTALYGFTYFAGRLLNFFLTPFYTRYFPLADYGIISLIYVYVTFFNILYTYGMETGYFYFTNKQKGSHNLIGGTAFLSMLYSSLALSGLLLIFAGPIMEGIAPGYNPNYVRCAALILAFDTLTAIPFAQLRRHDKAKRFAGMKLLGIILNIFFNFLFLFICPLILDSESLSFLHPVVNLIYDRQDPVLYVFLANVLSSGVTLALLTPEIKSFRLQFNKVIWRNMLRYSWPLLILGFAGMVNETLDRVLLNELLPGSSAERLAQVGIYSACYKLSIFMTLAVSSFRYAAEPFFFSQMRELDGKVLMARVMKYFCFATGLIFLGVMLYLPIAIQLIGKSYRQGLEVVPVLLLANLLLGVFYYLSQWYKQTSRTQFGAAISLGGAGITMVVNLIFIPHYGYMASAWATFLAYLFMAVTSYIFGQKYYPVPYDLKRIGLYLGTSVFLYFVSISLSDRPLGEYSLGMYIFNTLLIVGYIALFIWKEKPGFILNHPRIRKIYGRLHR